MLMLCQYYLSLLSFIKFQETCCNVTELTYSCLYSCKLYQYYLMLMLCQYYLSLLSFIEFQETCCNATELICSCPYLYKLFQFASVFLSNYFSINRNLLFIYLFSKLSLNILVNILKKFHTFSANYIGSLSLLTSSFIYILFISTYFLLLYFMNSFVFPI